MESSREALELLRHGRNSDRHWAALARPSDQLEVSDPRIDVTGFAGEELAFGRDGDEHVVELEERSVVARVGQLAQGAIEDRELLALVDHTALSRLNEVHGVAEPAGFAHAGRIGTVEVAAERDVVVASAQHGR